MLEIARKSIFRQEMNKWISKKRLRGNVIDLGGGKRSSYLNHFKIAEGTQVTSLNINPEDQPTIKCDLEKGVPLKNSAADLVLAFNLFEHIYHQIRLLKEVHRILKRGGILYAATPFIKEVHGDPGDYFRITPNGWEKLLVEAGFSDITVEKVPSGPFLASFSLLQTVLPNTANLLFFPVLYLADRLLTKLRPYWSDKYLLGVLIAARK